MKRSRRVFPAFRNDEEEARYWASHSSSRFWNQMTDAPEIVFAGPSKQVVTLRLERALVHRLRAIARERGMTYSALIRTWLIERVQKAG